MDRLRSRLAQQGVPVLDALLVSAQRTGANAVELVDGLPRHLAHTAAASERRCRFRAHCQTPGSSHPPHCGCSRLCEAEASSRELWQASTLCVTRSAPEVQLMPFFFLLFFFLFFKSVEPCGYLLSNESDTTSPLALVEF
ncbi:hypothetical protein CGRA01v4_05194 [Colletotrichum graminicola]|nr:hypothetical protein CGRA01v4_05194 [Colletotrichum graminicola]